MYACTTSMPYTSMSSFTRRMPWGHSTCDISNDGIICNQASPPPCMHARAVVTSALLSLATPYLLIGCHLCLEVTEVVAEVPGPTAVGILARGHEKLSYTWERNKTQMHTQKIHLYSKIRVQFFWDLHLPSSWKMPPFTSIKDLTHMPSSHKCLECGGMEPGR